MSFRVAFPFGNRSGLDHTMWPVITKEALRPLLVEIGFITTNEQDRFMDRVWPCPVSLEVLMHMAWKVREWKIAASVFTYTGRVNSGSPTPSWTISGTLPEVSVKPKRVKVPANLSDPLRDVRDEQDLLGPASDRNLSFTGGTDPWKTLRNAGVIGTVPSNDVALTGSGGVAPDIGIGNRDFTSDYRASMLGQYILYDPETETFFPALSAGGLFSVLAHDPPSPVTSGAKVEIYLLPVTPTATIDPAPSFGTAGDVQQGTLTIKNPIIDGDDILIPFGMLGSAAGRNPPAWPTGGTGSIDLMITPVKWWPFKTKVGNPVYNETTGAIENDPFS